MAKLDVSEIEAKAFFELYKDSKARLEVGYCMTMLKFKITEAFQKEKIAKEKKIEKVKKDGKGK